MIKGLPTANRNKLSITALSKFKRKRVVFKKHLLALMPRLSKDNRLKWLKWQDKHALGFSLEMIPTNMFSLLNALIEGDNSAAISSYFYFLSLQDLEAQEAFIDTAALLPRYISYNSSAISRLGVAIKQGKITSNKAAQWLSMVLNGAYLIDNDNLIKGVFEAVNLQAKDRLILDYGSGKATIYHLPL